MSEWMNGGDWAGDHRGGDQPSSDEVQPPPVVGDSDEVPAWRKALGVGLVVVVVAGWMIRSLAQIRSQSADERSDGWFNLGGLALGFVMVAASYWWVRRGVAAGNLVVRNKRLAPPTDEWDRPVGRRYFALSYLGTASLGAGLLIGMLTPWGVLLSIPVVVPLYWLAQRSYRRARRATWLADQISGPRLRLPIVAARRYEPGTWWERWAWIDVALMAAIAVVLVGMGATNWSP